MNSRDLTMTGGKGRWGWKSLLTLAALVVAGPGCFRHHTIEPGAWKLVIKPGSDNPDSAAYAKLHPLLVEVNLDWAKEGESLKMDYDEAPTKEDPEGRRYVLEGPLKDGKLDLKGVTHYWSLQFWGEVKSPRAVSGSVFGRVRNNDKIYFDGVWRMTKVQPKE
jgi:hypothetical protein